MNVNYLGIEKRFKLKLKNRDQETYIIWGLNKILFLIRKTKKLLPKSVEEKA